jgi:hypothetical protein
MLPETSDPRWRRVLLDKNIPKFSSLTTQLMYSRVKMTLQMDSSPSAVLAASKMVYDYFTKNASKVQPDLESLVNEMEKVNV